MESRDRTYPFIVLPILDNAITSKKFNNRIRQSICLVFPVLLVAYKPRCIDSWQTKVFDYIMDFVERFLNVFRSSPNAEITEIDNSIPDHPRFDGSIKLSKTLDDGESIYSNLNHIPYSEFTNINPIQKNLGKTNKYFISQKIYDAAHNRPWREVESVILLSFGKHDKCTQEFARMYSIPTHMYENPPNSDQFKRYSTWLRDRNQLIKGFTTHKDDYYLVVRKKFYHYYSLYGFCSACGILRCSPIWCICGHKELAEEWTSNNAKLDEFIRESQRLTKSANEAYLEWIPFEWVTIDSSDDLGDTACSDKCIVSQTSNAWPINKNNLDKFTKEIPRRIPYELTEIYSVNNRNNTYYLDQHTLTNDDDTQRYSNAEFVSGISTHCDVELIPVEIQDETDDSYYQMLCRDHPDMLDPKVWITVGFTYHTESQQYAVVKVISKWDSCNVGLCLSCLDYLHPNINAFCLKCKAPRPLDWTTGNKKLDSFLMKSWNNVDTKADGHIQWIEFSQLKSIQRVVQLGHKCTHTADWFEEIANQTQLRKVMIKKIVDGPDAHTFDFYQLTEGYPEILTPHNLWIVGITQEPRSGDYYLVFHSSMNSILDRFLQTININSFDSQLEFKIMQYEDFWEFKEIGSGSHGTVYTARCKQLYKASSNCAVLKSLNNFNQIIGSFISEVRNHARCSSSEINFLKIYGVTRHPKTGDYMIVMEYANDGNLFSFLEQNINKLTWWTKLQLLDDIANRLQSIHAMGLIHCDLHGGNIVLNNTSREEEKLDVDISKPFICDLGLSKCAHLSSSDSTTLEGVLPYTAPEVLSTRKFSQKTDIYSFGILMYHIASGEPPFRDRLSDNDLASDIYNGLRPTMPDSAPEPYKRLAERCCAADPNERPDASELKKYIQNNLVPEALKNRSDSDGWFTIYHNKNIQEMSPIEKARSYSSKCLPKVNLNYRYETLDYIVC